MRAIVQRVASASVRVDGKVTGAIDKSLLVLLGVAAQDGPDAAAYMAEKIATLRVFPDSGPDSGTSDDKMNRSVSDIGGGVLVVSQFTLFGDARRGRRPSFVGAAPPKLAQALYESFMENLRRRGLRVESGVFRAMMQVELVNDGPVTILIDSEKRF